MRHFILAKEMNQKWDYHIMHFALLSLSLRHRVFLFLGGKDHIALIAWTL